MRTLRCEKHGAALVMFCPVCRGQLSGAKKKTPAQLESLAKARAAKAAKRAKGGG